MNATARCIVVNEPGAVEGRNVCLFASHARTPLLKRHVLYHCRQLRAAGFKVVVALNVDLFGEDVKAPPDIDGLVLRENNGFDFGAWADLFRLFPSLWEAQCILLTNDSVYGPIGNYPRLMRRVTEHRADLIALTQSLEVKPHLQSYFLLMRRRALLDSRVREYWNNVRNLATKFQVIQIHELNIANDFASWGLRHGVVFGLPSLQAWPANPTLTLWEALIQSGYPFLKAQLLKQKPADVDASLWLRYVTDPELLAAIKEDLASQ
jgi:lipopolysaccharide biosynthesis protein